MTTIEPTHEDLHPAVEDDRLPSRSVWVTAAGFVVFIVVSAFVADWLLHAFGGHIEAREGAEAAPPQIDTIEQTLVRDTRRGLDLNDEKRRSLDRWGWVDRPHGVAHIPIDRAIELVVARPDGGP
jgi:hypothetical protein